MVLNSSQLLPVQSIQRLLKLIDEVPANEREELVKDWIVRYGRYNPIFQEHEDPELITILLIVENTSVDYWKHLYLVGDSLGWDIPQYQFTQIQDTKLWYILFDRPQGARLHYMLSPNDPGTRITAKTRMDRYSNFVLDTRNPVTIDEGLYKHSVIIGPGFHEQVVGNSHVAEFKNFYLTNNLEGDRSAKFCLLGDKKSPEKLMITHDGAAFTKIMKAPDILASGVEEGKWPSMAVLTLNTPVKSRVKEYGGRYGYPKYFKEVIIPTVQNHIGKTFAPDDIILCGSSLGAWAMLDVVCQNDEPVAKNLILQSCPFWWPDEDHQRYIRGVREKSEININRIFMDVGIYETGRIPMSTYQSNVEFARALEQQDVDFMAREFLMGHRYNSWAWSFQAAMDYIIAGKVEYGPLPGRKLNYQT